MGHVGCVFPAENLFHELDRSSLKKPNDVSVPEFSEMCWGRDQREWIV